MHGMRVVPLAGGMETKKVYWTVQSVEYAGTNVVNSSQQRFQPADVQSVQLKLLFYRTSVKVRDAFFGFDVGRSVLLTYPDQDTVSYPLSERSEVALPSLPRGNYTLSVKGPGPRMTRPVAVSRDQTLDLKFYSWLDVGVALAFLGLFGFGTLWVGWRRRRAARKGHPYLSGIQPRPPIGNRPGAGGKGMRRRLSRPWPRRSWATLSIGRRSGERQGEAQGMSASGSGPDAARSHDIGSQYRVRDAALGTKQAR